MENRRQSMVAVIHDPDFEKRVIAERRKFGLDRYDEVWEGVYFMSPAPNFEHQGIATELAAILVELVNRNGLGKVFGNCNVSDRDDWTLNYRIPDVAVFLRGNAARHMGTHCIGGPDLAIEIVSPDDRSWEKLPFYAAVGTKELLLLDRDPWALTLLQLK